MPLISDSGIAIVGMGAVFPGSRTARAFWANILAGHDASRDAVGVACDAAFFEADHPGVVRRGCFIDGVLAFDPGGLRIPPASAVAAEPEQLLCLHLARVAIHDAGYSRSRLRGARAGVVIGRGNTPGPRRIQVGDRVRGLELLRTQLFDAGAPDGASAAFAEAFLREAAGPATLGIGLVPNLVASRINQAFDIHGLAHTLDAACASALVALDRCCLELSSGRADLMLCGAVHLSRDEVFWRAFSEFGALSASGRIRPYDARADGLVIGEGAGMLVLKRECDAIRDQDRIYAVVRGCGIASDGAEAGLAAPSTRGQLRAIARAWEEAGEDPRQLGVLEGHGTGTVLGDTTELESIGQFFGDVRQGTLGSVKSMIGHAMPAAGMAGLIKTAWAIHHAVRPPSLHCEVPHPRLRDLPFTVSPTAAEWTGARRLAAVNAFGFGGVNAHVVLASSESSAPLPRVVPARWAVFAAPDAPSLASRIERGDVGGDGPVRASLTEPGDERSSLATRIIGHGVKRTRRLGVSICTEPLLGRYGKLAFVFPGFASRFEPRLDGLDSGAPAGVQDSAVRTGFEILRVNAVVARSLVRLGVEPDGIVGHSLGEWSAMIFSGMVAPTAVHAFAPGLSLGGDAHALGYLTASCGAEALSRLGREAGLELSHDNCPRQAAISGPFESLQRVRGILRSRGIVATIHSFGAGVHTRYFAERAAAHVENIRTLEFRGAALPTYSSVTAAAYPEDPAGIAAIAEANLTHPVRFREVIECMYDDGYRVFVQAGTGGLTPFIEDTLGDRPHLAISANVPTRSGLEQLVSTACDVWTAGGSPLFDIMSDFARVEAPVPFDLGLRSPLPRRIWSLQSPRPRVPAEIPDELLARFDANVEALTQAQLQVARQAASVGKESRSPGAGTALVTRKARFSVEGMPELADHCLYPQAVDCRDWRLRKPVVPLAGLLIDMAERAQAEWSGLVAVGLSDVVARRWLDVSSAVELDVGMRREGDRVDITLGQYAQGVVNLGPAYHEAYEPGEGATVDDGWTLPMQAEDLYTGGWMFHGPAYRGVRRFLRVGELFAEAELEVTAGKGALIDAAAQVLGALVMARTTQNRLAMPVGVSQMSLHGAYPALGQKARCHVKLDMLSEELAEGTLSIHLGARLWARLSGWRLRRIPSDHRMFDLMRMPAWNTLSTCPAPGLAVFVDRYPSALEQEFIACRYLAASELTSWNGIAPAQRRRWLSQRVAMKDAVLSRLRGPTSGEVFPGDLIVQRRAAGDAVIHDRAGTVFDVACLRSDDAVVAEIITGATRPLQLCASHELPRGVNPIHDEGGYALWRPV